jgi:hypothetical protein
MLDMHTDGGPGAKISRGPEDEAGQSARNALLEALDAYRSGMKDLHEAAEQAGVASWDLLEAAQSTPDPMVIGFEGATDLQPFVRRRDE